MLAVAGLFVVLTSVRLDRVSQGRGGPLARLLFRCKMELPVTGFVLAQGTHQTGCTIADIPGVEYSTVKPAGAADITTCTCGAGC